MKSFLRILPFLFLACALRAQTTGFTNVNIKGTESVISGGNLSLLSGSTFNFQIAGTTNSLLYITNGSGNVGALGLGAGLSVSGGNLVAGSSTSANPTAKVGPSVVNGSASTFMRSDAAPAIDLTATYPWTGVHSFSYTAIATTSTTEFGIQIIPTLNQRNAALFSLVYGNETITQAGSGQQDLIDLEIGLVKKFEVDSTGSIITGAFKGSTIGSIYGGTGLSSFTQGSLLMASGANTWSALADGTVNYVLTASGAGIAPSYQPISTILDSIGSTQGMILERGVSAWQTIATGTTGQVLASQGAAADPHWVNAAVPPGSTTQHDVASYSNTVGGLEDLGAIVEGTVTSSVTSTDNDSNGTWKVVNNSNIGSGNSAYGQTIYAPNLGGSGGVGEIDSILGVNSSSANFAYWGFNFTSAGSGSNFMDWGFGGHLNLMQLSQTGTLSTVALTATTGGIKTGVQGSTAGSLIFYNATSGNIQILPPTGALGTPALTLPDQTGTLALSQASADVQTVASGTAYTLTASNADVVFGTTSPTVTLTVAGTYEISVTIGTQLSGASFAAAQSVSYNLRRQNNTPADLAGSTFSAPLSTVAITTVTDAAPTITIASFQYSTSSTSDVIGIRGVVSATPSLGSVTCNAATIAAVWIHP